jgi:hypothetical protein
MQKIKRGDAVQIQYLQGISNCIVYGIVLSVSKKSVTLGHNFNDFIPLDTTKIALSAIQKVSSVIPSEI